MNKDDVEQRLNRTDELPVLKRELSTVLEEIEQTVPGKATKEMMYDLVSVILAMGERIYELERRVCPSGIRDELTRQQRSRERKQT